MKVAMPGATRLSQALKALPRVRAAAARKRPSLLADSFRLLALNIRLMLPPESNRGVIVMSAFPEDGRSFVAENLAVALADEGRVLLVEQVGEDMPLRDRVEAHRNGGEPGLPSALRGLTMGTHHPGVFLHPYAPARGNYEGELAATINDAASAGFFTVVDSPPALTSSAAFLLAREVRNVVYVVTRRVQDTDVHRQIREQLERLDARILGLVLNEV